MGFLDKAKEAAQQAAAKAQQQVSTMQQQSAANKASGISTGSRDALLRDLGAAYVALKQGAGSQEAVDAAFTAVEEHDTQFANMGSLDDLDTRGGFSSQRTAAERGCDCRSVDAGRRGACSRRQFHARRHVIVRRRSDRRRTYAQRELPGSWIGCTRCALVRAAPTNMR